MIRGVLGGSFDPVHAGHVELAAWLLDRGRVDRLVVVPARLSPHKEHTIASPEDRLAMVRLAFAGEPRVEIEELELRRPGPSYTVDTLSDLVARRPADDWRLVIGADNLASFPDWREPERILELARLLVVPRRGWPLDVPPPLDPARVDVVEGFAREVSSSGIRAMVGEGRDPVPALPPDVLAYVRERGLYGA